MGHLMTLKRVLVGLSVMVAVLAAASLALAQEATAAATETAPAVTAAPPGGGLLFLLVGLGAIALIAAIWLVRERTETSANAV